MMTIQQTIDIPADRHVSIDLPESVPVGKTSVILMFSSPEKAKTELPSPLEDAQEIWDYNRSHSAEVRAKLQKLQSVLPVSSFGGMDGVTYQRKVRDEWEDE